VYVYIILYLRAGRIYTSSCGDGRDDDDKLSGGSH